MLCPERDLSRNGIYFKHLALITPERALKEHSLSVKTPVFVHGSSNVEYRELLYRAGEVVEAPKFSPKRWQGIVFEHTYSRALTNSSEQAYAIQQKSWVGFVEAIGPVYTRDEERIIDYRLARAVRIERIEAHCQFCAEDSFLNIPVDQINLPYQPLRQGFAFDGYHGLMGEGILGAVCDVEKHSERRPWLENVVRYRFQFSEDGDFTTSSI